MSPTPPTWKQPTIFDTPKFELCYPSSLDVFTTMDEIINLPNFGFDLSEFDFGLVFTPMHLKKSAFVNNDKKMWTV